MPTIPIPLMPGGASFPDAADIQNMPAGLSRRQGSQTTGKSYFLTLDFDGAGTNTEFVSFAFTAPVGLITTMTGTIKVWGMANTTTSTFLIQVAVSSVSPGDADTPLEHAFAAASSMTITANGTEARRELFASVQPEKDGMAAGDYVQVRIFRSPANALDESAVDFEYLAGEYELPIA